MAQMASNFVDVSRMCGRFERVQVGSSTSAEVMRDGHIQHANKLGSATQKAPLLVDRGWSGHIQLFATGEGVEDG